MKRITIALAAVLTVTLAVIRIRAQSSPDLPPLMRQTQAEADAKSAGCLSCHNGIEPMHASFRCGTKPCRNFLPSTR